MKRREKWIIHQQPKGRLTKANGVVIRGTLFFSSSIISSLWIMDWWSDPYFCTWGPFNYLPCSLLTQFTHTKHIAITDDWTLTHFTAKALSGVVHKITDKTDSVHSTRLRSVLWDKPQSPIFHFPYESVLFASCPRSSHIPIFTRGYKPAMYYCSVFTCYDSISVK